MNPGIWGHALRQRRPKRTDGLPARAETWLKALRKGEQSTDYRLPPLFAHIGAKSCSLLGEISSESSDAPVYFRLSYSRPNQVRDDLYTVAVGLTPSTPTPKYLMLSDSERFVDFSSAKVYQSRAHVNATREDFIQFTNALDDSLQKGTGTFVFGKNVSNFDTSEDSKIALSSFIACLDR